jgi:hypothetical protein
MRRKRDIEYRRIRRDRLEDGDIRQRGWVRWARDRRCWGAHCICTGSVFHLVLIAPHLYRVVSWSGTNLSASQFVPGGVTARYKLNGPSRGRVGGPSSSPGTNVSVAKIPGINVKSCRGQMSASLAVSTPAGIRKTISQQHHDHTKLKGSKIRQFSCLNKDSI